MVRPRIIIADTDKNYVQSLQLKFVEEFFEKIDLEIITDEVFFEKLFRTPQKADILIVSEDLYSSELQKHNINYVFLMAEINENDVTCDLSVNRIYKYSSIKEIFNEILGISAGNLLVQTEVKQDTQIILVYSACGGVGKTTIAMGICRALADNYKKVLYIGAARVHSFQHLLVNKTPITSAEIYTKLAVANDKIFENINYVIRNEVFSYLPPFKAPLMALGIDYAVYNKLVLSAKKTKEYDFIIVDADEAFDEDKAELITMADKVIILTKQSRATVYATDILAGNISGIDSGKYIFVCNDFSSDAENALISPAVTLRFSIAEYVEHIVNIENKGCKDIAREEGIQKIAFWIM